MSHQFLKSPFTYAFVIALTAVILFASFSRSSTPTASAASKPGAAPRTVIVELFTSEGCSSCPPADALLKNLSESQSMNGIQIIALEEHVDYWNNLGWKDPFSSNEFSQRQSDYANSTGRDGVYTPQMIVDGRTEFVGSRSSAARQAIMQAATSQKAEIVLQPAPGSATNRPSFKLDVQNLPALPEHNVPELWVAVTERGLESNVGAGENSGQTLQHAAVVRRLRKATTLNGSANYTGSFDVPLDPNWKRENLSVVVFLSESRTRKIIGAATASL